MYENSIESVPYTNQHDNTSLKQFLIKLFLCLQNIFLRKGADECADLQTRY